MRLAGVGDSCRQSCAKRLPIAATAVFAGSAHSRSTGLFGTLFQSIYPAETLPPSRHAPSHPATTLPRLKNPSVVRPFVGLPFAGLVLPAVPRILSPHPLCSSPPSFSFPLSSHRLHASRYHSASTIPTTTTSMNPSASKMEFVPLTRLRGWIYTKPEFTKPELHVLSRYFEAEYFFDRPWDLYHYEGTSLDFLVPFSQATSFLSLVASETGIFKSLVNIPPAHLLHDTNPSSDPSFFQTVTSKSSYDALASASFWDSEDPDIIAYVPPPKPSKPPADPRAKEAKKKQKAKKRKHVMAMNRAQVRNMRCYLGFGNTANADGGKESEDELVTWTNAGLRPVLVSLDVEAYEHNHSCITEIGISTLDTALLPSPSPSADEIIKRIDYHHFRILEHRTLRNGSFISDAAERFEFGESTFIPLKETPARIAAFFRSDRRVVVIGHDVKGDIDYLKVVGYDLKNVRNLEVIDTADMWKAVTRDPNGRGLSSVLLDLDIHFWNLHNAGNDAAFTLQAAIKIAEMGVPPRKNAAEIEKERERKKAAFLNPNDFVIGVVKKNEDK